METLGNFEESLHISDEAKKYLNESAKWGKFLAIVGFVICGLIILFGVFFSTIMSSLTSISQTPNPYSAIPSFAIAVIYLVIGVIYVMPCYYLYKFSVNTKLALQTDDTPTLTYALENHKSMFKFMGIFTAVILGFYAIIFIFAIIGGAFMASRANG